MKNSTNFLLKALILIGALLPFSSVHAGIDDLFRGQDRETLAETKAELNEEFNYRTRVDAEASGWVQELMYMYRWSALDPANQDVKNRLKSELAWLTVSGYGLVATFDFGHAETTLLGSTSRLVLTLMKSKNFWIEVGNQCREINDLKRSHGLVTDVDAVKSCAERFQRDLKISQVIGSNISVLVGGGLLFGAGKRIYQRYASKWIATRILPWIPAFARTKWFIGGALATAVVVPASVVVADIKHEQETNRIFFEDLNASLQQGSIDADKVSVLRIAAAETELQVFALAIWLKTNVPHGLDEQGSRDFVLRMMLSAPHLAQLQQKKAELESQRSNLEAELSSIPGVSDRLVKLAREKRAGALNPEDAALFHKAQYLASLRLVLKAL